MGMAKVCYGKLCYGRQGRDGKGATRGWQSIQENVLSIHMPYCQKKSNVSIWRVFCCLFFGRVLYDGKLGHVANMQTSLNQRLAASPVHCVLCFVFCVQCLVF